MLTKPQRMLAEDVQRLRVLAAVRNETPQQLLHRALNEFIEAHRSELDGSFERVQSAVLSNDREQLRAVFAAAVPGQVEADLRRIDRLFADTDAEGLEGE